MEHLVEMLQAHILDHLITDDRGIIHQNINIPAESLDGLVDDMIGRGGVLEIALDSYGGAVGFGFYAGDQVGGGFTGAVAGVGYDYFCAAGGEVVGYC